jgi:hypothetical protein
MSGGTKRTKSNGSAGKKKLPKRGDDEEPSVLEAREDSLDGMTGGVHTLTFNPTPAREKTDDQRHAPHVGPGGDTRFYLLDREVFPRSAYPDHLPIESDAITQDTVRDYVVYTVPSRALKPDAQGWGDFNVSTSNAGNLDLLRSFSFFMYALEKHTPLFSTRVFAEAVVCNSGEMKPSVGAVADASVAYEPYKGLDQLLTRSNLAGYRIWVLFYCHSAGPETMMRRAVVELQIEVGFCRPMHALYKRMFATITDPGYRSKAISDYAMAEAEKATNLELAKYDAAMEKDEKKANRAKPAKKPKSKRRKSKKSAASAFLDDEAGGDSEDDEDDPREEEPADPSAAGDETQTHRNIRKMTFCSQFFCEIQEAIHMALMRPHSNTEIDAYKNTRQKKLWQQHTTVGGSLVNYLRRFIAPIHHATRTFNNWKISQAELLVHGEWPDCVDFMAKDESYLAVYSVLDFDKSAAVLEDIGTRGSDSRNDSGPCAVQVASLAYGLNAGEIYFPFRDLVWELNARTMGVVVLSQKFCWGSLKFADMLTSYWHMVHEHERLTKNAKIGSDGIYVPKEPERMMSHNYRLMEYAASRGARAAYLPTDELEERLRVASRESIHARRLRDMAGAPKPTLAFHNDEFDDDDNPEGSAPLPGITGDYEKMIDLERLGDDIAYLDLNPNRGDVVNVIENAFAPLFRANESLIKDTKTVFSRLPLPKSLASLGVDLQVYRRTREMQLHHARRSEHFDAIMAILAEARNTSDIQNQLYQILSVDGSVQHRQIFTPVPNASIHANMILADAAILQIGTGAHHGVEHYHHALTMILSAADPMPRMAQQASMTVGAPATGKSKLWSDLAMVVMGGALTETGHTSQLDGFNASRVGTNSVQVMDEAGPVMTRHTLEVQAANADKIAKAKSAYSTNAMIASRLGWKEGPSGKKAITERTIRDLHHATVGNANSYTLGATADMALPTRHDVVLWLTAREETTSVVNKINDPNKEKRVEFWKATRPQMMEEQAIAIFISILHRCGVIDSIDTSVLSLVTSTALEVADRWFPQVFSNIRANLRNEEYARKGMIRTAVWRMMRSQASPLLMFSGDLDEIISSEAMDIRDIAKEFTPYLYSTYEDAIVSLCRMIAVDYSPDMWLVMRAIASIQSGFRRELMKKVWRANKIELIDDEVERIMKERGDVFPHQSIVDMDKLEAGLDFIAGAQAASNPPLGQTGPVDEYGPRFARFWDTNRNAQQSAPANRFGGARRSASFGDDDFASDGSAQIPGGCDPNWIVLGASYSSIADSCMQFLSQLLTLSPDVIRSTLNLLATKVVRVPMFSLVRGTEPHLCKFNQIVVQRDSNGAPRYDTVPVLKVHIMGKDLQEVRVSTGALMLPPAHLLFVMLTAGENQHTRPVTTVLPMMVRGFPGRFYQWQIKPRKAVTLSIINHSSNTRLDTMRQCQMPVVRDSGILDSISKTQVTIADDFEKIYFEKHMRASNTEPEYKMWLQMLRRSLPVDSTYIEDEDLELKGPYPTAVQYEKMIRHWIDHSPAAPGHAEAQVRYLYANSKVFKEHAHLMETEYPRTDITMDRMKFRVLSVCKQTDCIYMPRKSQESTEPAFTLHWLGLRRATNYVKCLEWKLFGGEWHSNLRAVFEAGLFMDVLRIASGDVIPALEPGEQLVPRAPVPIPAGMEEFLADNTRSFSSREPKSADAVLLCDFYGPEHLDFLDQFFTVRQALREVSLALTINPALSVAQAFDYVMDAVNRDTLKEMNEIINACKLARVELASFCAPGQVAPEPPQSDEYDRYIAARDTIRSMRAIIYVRLLNDHSSRIYNHATQKAAASGESSKPNSNAAGSARAIGSLRQQATRNTLLALAASGADGLPAAAAANSVLGSAPPAPAAAAAESLPSAIGTTRPRFDTSGAKPYKFPSHLLKK